MSEELLQLIDRRGKPVGTAPRSECHGNPELIQTVVHLHLFDEAGKMYLQKRARSKDIFPGRWDTSVGGHVAPGETPDQAIRREAREELGIDLDGSGGIGGLERLQPYIYGDETETEFVTPFRVVFSGSPQPNPEEAEDIHRSLIEQPEEFTPHFRSAFGRLLKAG